MSTIEAGVDGVITIGDATAKEVNLVIDPESEAFTNHVSKSQIIPGDGGADVLLDKGGIGEDNISFIWIRLIKETDGTPQALQVKTTSVGGVNATMGKSSAYLYICNPKSQADINTVSVSRHADTEVVAEYILGGDA